MGPSKSLKWFWKELSKLQTSWIKCRAAQIYCTIFFTAHWVTLDREKSWKSLLMSRFFLLCCITVASKTLWDQKGSRLMAKSLINTVSLHSETFYSSISWGLNFTWPGSYLSSTFLKWLIIKPKIEQSCVWKRTKKTPEIRFKKSFLLWQNRS